MKKSFFVDISLLKTNSDFRKVFIARAISILGLGMLAVAVPIQVHQLTGSTFHVGMAMALDGIGMFVGLLLGGVLADKYDRRRLILIARSVCGLGFIGLTVNSLLPEPSLAALYVLSVWDGFFGALGVTALMAATPHIVGRENLMQAGALGMLAVRTGSVISPAIGGAVIAAAGVSWNYAIAAIMTCITLIPLYKLPAMKPKFVEDHNPVQALIGGFKFLFSNKIVLSVMAMGTLVTLTGAIRVLFPAMVMDDFAKNAFLTGLIFSMVPLGATLAALTSGWANQVKRPGVVMSFTSLAVFSCVILIGLAPNYYFVLVSLVVYGYLSSICGLIQYTLVQANTPDEYLGRVNSLWTAQDVSGESGGAVAVGALGKLFTPMVTIVFFGSAALATGLLIWLLSYRVVKDVKLDTPEMAN